jgi:hypothetical protein
MIFVFIEIYVHLGYCCLLIGENTKSIRKIYFLDGFSLNF